MICLGDCDKKSQKKKVIIKYAKAAIGTNEIAMLHPPTDHHHAHLHSSHHYAHHCLSLHHHHLLLSHYPSATSRQGCQWHHSYPRRLCPRHSCGLMTVQMMRCPIHETNFSTAFSLLRKSEWKRNEERLESKVNYQSREILCFQVYCPPDGIKINIATLSPITKLR